MRRSEACRWICAAHPDSVIVFSNGLTSREAVQELGLGRYFYMVHAMGESLSVGTGLARSRPDLDVVVIEGDGNASMGAAAWCEPPENLTHYVLANGVHETTGGQPVSVPRPLPPWIRVVPIEIGAIGAPNPPPPSAIKDAVLKWLSERGVDDE